MSSLPPFVLFYVAAFLAAVLHGRVRAAVLVTVPILGAINVYGLEDGVLWQLAFLDFEFEPLRVDTLSRLFGYLFHIGALLAIIFSLHLRAKLESVAGLIYAGSALGAVFSGDLISLFVFWELMAVSSTFLILASNTDRARHAAKRYLIIQVLSGLLLLAGAAIQLHETGSLTFGYIGLGGLASWLIFLAFGIKCAFPLLHNWLTDAYPEATPTGTVFLIAFTTKAAVYALARGFPGTELLIYIGGVMTCFPIFYAVIENDLRRVLAYSMINQIGFMVCGVGIGTALALNGAVAHAFNDVIFKGLLMMSMGSVLHMTGRMNGSDLGQLYKSMPITTGLCIVGAASISAFPLFSGFVSKSMVMVAVLQEGHTWVWLAMLFASAGVFHHAGIKIPFFAFFAHDSGIRTTEPPRNMLIAMGLAAALCVFIGCYPRFLYSLLPYATDYTAYDATHVLAQLQVLFFSALAFVWLKLTGLYPPELHSTNLDVEWAYRKSGFRAARGLYAGLNAFYASCIKGVQHLGGACGTKALDYVGPDGKLGKAWPTDRMVFLAVLTLGVYLLVVLAG